ncbi:PD-(D/E)XK nuclease family protein [Jeotgalicoccus psychrophilus]|uniref:PDDEXK-like family protein n=1 Tax=Jeotgalicoccus psychrophilus TaxID=157228 RepID=UPI00040BC8B1|nr:PD-(D/E)XK nuclease family protein [Jeotgalicoccus psychrophilus]
MKESPDKIALEEFLKDIEVLQKVEDGVSTFNVFDILGVVNNELRHSNMLRWLMTPSEAHGLDDLFMKKLIQKAIVNDKNSNQLYDMLSTLLNEYSDLVVYRERKNIDILAVSENSKFVLAIENKIWSVESKYQLKKYEKIVSNDYPDYSQIFIYLSPYGTKAKNSNAWINMSYRDVIDILKFIIDHRKNKIDTSIINFIEQYIEILRRNIVGDSELKKICEEIYFKHKRALDLIYEHKPDLRTEISDELKEFIKGEKTLILDDSNKHFIRFTTNRLDEIIPKISDWTSSKRLMLFEIDNLNPLKIALVLGKGDDQERRELYEVARRNEFKGISTLERHFPRLYSSQLYEYKEYENYEETLDKVVEQMQLFISIKLPEIENTIINQYNK